MRLEPVIVQWWKSQLRRTISHSISTAYMTFNSMGKSKKDLLFAHLDPVDVLERILGPQGLFSPQNPPGTKNLGFAFFVKKGPGMTTLCNRAIGGKKTQGMFRQHMGPGTRQKQKFLDLIFGVPPRDQRSRHADPQVNILKRGRLLIE